MNKQIIMKRFFNLYLLYLKSDDEDSRETLMTEIKLLYQDIKNNNTIPNDIKKNYSEILQQYSIIYGSDELIERYEAEDRVRELIENIKRKLEEEM